MKLFVLPALLCLSFCVNAQLHWALTSGIQLNTASYKVENAKIPANNIIGFNAGVLAKVYFDDKAAFVTGLQYNAKGYTVVPVVGDPKKTYRLNYVDIPVMIQIDVSKTRAGGLYLKAGPSVGIGVSGKEIYTDKNGMEVRNKAILSVTGNHFGLFDASLNAALGYNFTSKFFAEAAYAYGIGNIDNDPDGPNIKTRVASFSIGYFLK